MNLSNNKRLHQLLTKTGLMDEKASLVKQFTNNRTEYSSHMNDLEAVKLISFLEQKNPQESPEVKNQLRRRIISKFREMDYNKAGEADMARIQETVEKHWLKKLNNYNTDELRKIIGVLERKWLPWYYKQKEEQKA